MSRFYWTVGVMERLLYNDGETPLHMVIDTNSWAVLRITSRLLQHSCDVNIVDNTGRNAFLVLAYCIAQYVANERCKPPVIDKFCDLFKEILKNKSDPACKDTRGNTVLHVFGHSLKTAFYKTYLYLIPQLLQLGGDILLHNNESQSFYTMFKEYSAG